MKWIFRQIFYCVSVLSVLFTVGTVSVFAEGVEFSMPGSGTKSEPYLVSTFEHLSEIAEVSVSDSLDDIYFLQTQDITVNSDEIISVNSGYFRLGTLRILPYSQVSVQMQPIHSWATIMEADTLLKILY